MITNVSGNLLLDDADALVNTVNTVGVMGKGLAWMRAARVLEGSDPCGAVRLPGQHRSTSSPGACDSAFKNLAMFNISG